MKLKELKEIIQRGEDSHNQFKENIRNSDSLAAEVVQIRFICLILALFVSKEILTYIELRTSEMRTLQHWPNIQFVDDRDSCLFTSRVDKIKVQNGSNKIKLEVHDEPVNVSLSKLQKEILNIIKDNPAVTYEIIAYKLDKDRSTVKRNIQKLKDAGILKRIGSKKTGHWEILQ